MIDPITAALLTQIVVPALTNAGSNMPDLFKKVIANGNAINDFGNSFLEGNDLSKFRNGLRDWCSSNEFDKNFQSWAIDPKGAVKSFSEHSKITQSPSSEYSLDFLIAEFLVNLSIHLELLDSVFRVRNERKKHLELIGLLEKIKTQADTLIATDSHRSSKLDQVVEKSELIQAQIQTLTELSIQQANGNAAYSYEPQDFEDKQPDELELHALIDTAVSHIKRDRLMTAIDFLNQARRNCSLSADASTYVKSRIACNLGVCHSRLENVEGALQEHRTALDFRRSKLNLSNLAGALLQNKVTAEALFFSKEAMSLAVNGRTLAIHLQILGALGQTDEIHALELEHKHLCNYDSNCLLALGQNAYDQGDLGLAKSKYDSARKLEPYDPQLLLLSAWTLFRLIEMSANGNTPLNGRPPQETLNAATEIIELTTEALSLLNYADYSLNKVRALELRASAHFLHFNLEEAEKDCLEILSLDPTNVAARVRCAYLSVDIHNDLERALEYWNQVDLSKFPHLTVVAAGLCIDLNRLEEAETLLNTFESTVDKKKLWYLFAREKLRLSEKNSRTNEIIEQLKTNYPDNADIYYAIAELHKREGRISEALSELSLAADCNVGTLKLFIPRLKAEIYCDGKLWLRAVETYESFADLRTNNADCLNYIVALFYADQIATAGVAAKEARLRNSGVVLKQITEIEIIYYVNKLFDTVTARPLAIVLAKLFPSPAVSQLLKYINNRFGYQDDDLSDHN